MHDKFIWYFMEKYRQNDYSYKLNKTLETKIQSLKFHNVYITQTSPNLQFSLKFNYTLIFPHKKYLLPRIRRTWPKVLSKVSMNEIWKTFFVYQLCALPLDWQCHKNLSFLVQSWNKNMFSSAYIHWAWGPNVICCCQLNPLGLEAQSFVTLSLKHDWARSQCSAAQKKCVILALLNSYCWKGR